MEYVLPVLVCLSVSDHDKYKVTECGRISFVLRYNRWRDVEVKVKKLRKPALVYIECITSLSYL